MAEWPEAQKKLDNNLNRVIRDLEKLTSRFKPGLEKKGFGDFEFGFDVHSCAIGLSAVGPRVPLSYSYNLRIYDTEGEKREFEAIDAVKSIKRGYKFGVYVMPSGTSYAHDNFVGLEKLKEMYNQRNTVNSH